MRVPNSTAPESAISSTTLERATAATSRIVLRTAGLVPHVYGRGSPVERAILSAAASMDASLLILPLGGTARARNQAVSIARFVACSVLTIPVPSALPRTCERLAGADARDAIGPAAGIGSPFSV